MKINLLPLFPTPTSTGHQFGGVFLSYRSAAHCDRRPRTWIARTFASLSATYHWLHGHIKLLHHGGWVWASTYAALSILIRPSVQFATPALRRAPAGQRYPRGTGPGCSRSRLGTRACDGLRRRPPPYCMIPGGYSCYGLRAVFSACPTLTLYPGRRVGEPLRCAAVQQLHQGAKNVRPMLLTIGGMLHCRCRRRERRAARRLPRRRNAE